MRAYRPSMNPHALMALRFGRHASKYDAASMDRYFQAKAAETAPLYEPSFTPLMATARPQEARRYQH